MSTAAVAEPIEVTWENLIPSAQWAVYACILHHACEEGIPFALGGGLALGYYTGHLRRSRDLDIYVSPEYRERMKALVTRCGLIDYFDTCAYDRGWIYRAHTDGIIVDTIWAMANRRTLVDEVWTSTGPMIQLCGQSFRVIPPEELIWSKLYVLQRDRCDWPDIMSLIYATGPTLQWKHLLRRVGADLPLLRGLLSVFSWISPAKAAAMPADVWTSLDLQQPPHEAPDSCVESNRKDLLDTRPWLIVGQQTTKAA